jgi:hypothetical protein
MLLPLATLALGTQLVLNVADRVPDLNVRPSCVAGAMSGISTRPDVNACMKDEQDARDQLGKQWGQFAASDKLRCGDMARMGGPSSYVELLTCLEMAQETKKLPAADEDFGIAPISR